MFVRSLGVFYEMVSRGIWFCLLLAIESKSIAKAKTIAVESTISQPGIGLGLSLSISGPLAVSVSESTIAIASITKANSVAVESTVSQPRLSLSISGPLAISV